MRGACSVQLLTIGEPGFPSPQEWDAFVSASPHGHLLQSWGWGELKGRFGWQPLRLAVRNGGSLQAAAQALVRPLPYRSLAYVPRGPACDPCDTATLRLLFQGLHQAARRRGAIALKVEPPALDGPQAPVPWLNLGFRPTPQTIQPRRTMMVDLEPDEDQILARMKNKWRYNVRLAARKDISVRQGGPADLPAFHRLMLETGRRDGFGVHAQAYYQAALELFRPGEQVALLIAEYRGEPLAALMALACGETAIYMFGASSDRERQRMPNHLLQWEAMRWAKARGCRRYDLWGIPDVDPDSPSAGLAGVERFKAGFGGEPVRFAGAFDYVYAPLVYWAFNRLWSWRRARARRSQPEAQAEAEQE
ncbi:MAG: lipid II:glycine glycyltransferase FemX [Anaerolineae bacterium]